MYHTVNAFQGTPQAVAVTDVANEKAQLGVLRRRQSPRHFELLQLVATEYDESVNVGPATKHLRYESRAKESSPTSDEDRPSVHILPPCPVSS
jgi:hypothetical protein